MQRNIRSVRRGGMIYRGNFGRLDRRRFLALGAAAGAAALLPARADQVEPAIVYDYGGKWDKSFNEAAFEGAERFRKETGIGFRDFEIASESQRDQALQTMARRGAPLVIGVGFANAVPLDRAQVSVEPNLVRNKQCFTRANDVERLHRIDSASSQVIESIVPSCYAVPSRH